MRRLVGLGVCAALACGCALDSEGQLATGQLDAGSAGGTGGAAGGASGGTGGASGGAGNGTGGAGGSGGTPIGDAGGEDCLDSIDNDGDTLIDCADPECAPGHQCVPEAPPGWIGYSRTRGDVYGAPDGPPCADGSSPTRYSSAPAGPAECQPCGCGPLAGASCGQSQLLCYPGSTSCSGAPQDWTGQVGGSCSGGSASINTISCKLGPTPMLAPGSCPSTGGDYPNKDLFTTVTDVCRAQGAFGAGCDQGQVCIPRGDGDYAGYVCVESPNAVPCPAGWGVQVVGYTGATEGRGCTACTCAVQPGCASSVYTFYDGAFCDVDSDPVTSDQCNDVSWVTDFGLWSYERTKSASPSGTCTPSGGQPFGAVHPTGAITFCCRN